MPHPIDLIKQFSSMPPELESRLRQIMVERTYNRGDIISGLGTLPSNAYYIQKGAARVFYVRGGKEHTFSFSFDDEFILLSQHLLQENDDTMSIQFLEPTTVITLPHGQVKDAMVNSDAVNLPEALLFINVALRHCQLYLEEMLLVLQHSSAEERYRWAVSRYPRLLEMTTVTHLASFLGVTKETLYRIRSGNY